MPRLAAVAANDASQQLLSVDAPLRSADSETSYKLPSFLKGVQDAEDPNSRSQMNNAREVVGSVLADRMDILEYQFSKQEHLLRELFETQSKSLEKIMTGLLAEAFVEHPFPAKYSSQMSSQQSFNESDDGHGPRESFLQRAYSTASFGPEETIEFTRDSFLQTGDIGGFVAKHDSEEESEAMSLITDSFRMGSMEEDGPVGDDCCSRCFRAMRDATPQEPRSRLPIRATEFMDIFSGRNGESQFEHFDDPKLLPDEWWHISRIVRSNTFTAVTSFIIGLNAIYMGYSADTEMHRQKVRFEEHTAYEEPVCVDAFDLIFTLVFGMELVLRIWGYGCVFLCGTEGFMNVFDALVVLASVAQVGLSPFVDTTDFRVVRIIRLIRVLSSLRKVPCLRKLEHMLVAVSNTLPALAPAVMLLLLMMYMFVVFFMQGLVTYLSEADVRDPNAGGDDLLQAFGSVTNALETLFLSVVGGRNWDGLLVALRRVGPLYEITFPLYVGFVTFAVLNILTGIFVDAAQQFSSMDRELAVELQVDKEKEYVKGLMNLFVEADVDKSGTLTWDEFMGHFESSEVRAYLKGMDLNVTSAKKIFNLIDGDNTGEIGIQAFLETCLQLRGTAQVVDIVIMRSDMENMMEQKMNSMLEKVGALRKFTAKAFTDMKSDVKKQSSLGSTTSTEVKKQSSIASSRQTGGRASVRLGASAISNTNSSPRTTSVTVGPASRNSTTISARSRTISTTNRGAASVVDMGSYGAYKADGTGITGLRNTLLSNHEP